MRTRTLAVLVAAVAVLSACSDEPITPERAIAPQADVVLGPPTIAGLSPANGPTSGGNLVHVIGAFFSADASVLFNGVKAVVQQASPDVMTVVAPPGDAGALVQVTVPGRGISNQVPYTYDVAAIAGFSPTTGPTAGGTTITITGMNFGPRPMVLVGSALAAIVSHSHTQIIAVTPGGTGSADVTVVSGRGPSVASQRFTYVDTPQLLNITPAHGPTTGGTVITLTGTGFGTTGAVLFGSQSAPAISWSNTLVTAAAPAGQGSVEVTLATSGGLTAPRTYTYDAPAITSVTPASGPSSGGTRITITGQNFGLNPAVTVGGRTATPVVDRSHTHIVALTPAGTPGSAEPVVVTVAGSASPANATFTYDAPAITSIAPTGGPTAGGTTITITGTSFGTEPRVTFGGVDAPVESATHTQITAKLPAGVGGTVPVTVFSGTAASNTASYTYGAPAITAVTPASGPAVGGTTITIQGTNFGISPSVTVGGQPAAIQDKSHTSITATTPSGSGVADVRVTAAGTTATATAAFTYIANPVIAQLYPANGPTAGGTTITIVGTGFGTTARVLFAGSAIVPTRVLDTQVHFTLPAGEGSAQVQVETSGVTSAAATFQYDAPSISSINPASGLTTGGATVILTGANFGLNPVVSFGGLQAPVQSRTHTSLTVTAPTSASAGPVQVSVSAGGQSSNTVTYLYEQPAPAITSVQPQNGPTAGGVAITITGSNLGSAPVVTFGGQAASVTSSSNTHVVVQSPAGEGLVPVRVQSGALTSNALDYQYAPPAIAAVTPGHGPSSGGTLITITGANFGIAPAVTIGGTAAPVEFASHTQLRVRAPVGEPGQTALVQVQVAGALSNTAAFSYDAPSITAVQPASGPTSGGIPITIVGASFGAAPAVTVGGVNAPVTSASHTSIIALLPAGEGSAAVQVRSGIAVSNLATFQYAAPVLTGITPSSGPVAGGTTITLTGQNFGLNPSVSFGEVAAPVLSRSHTQLVVASPAGAPGSVPVRVSVAGAASNGLSYTYLCAAGTYAEGGQCVTPGEAVTLLQEMATESGVGAGLTNTVNILTDNNPSNDAAACGQLGAFLNQLSARERQGRISAADAAALRASTSRLQQSLGCG